MRPGPAKQFDPERALERARDLFWRRGFDGTGLAELEAELGIGRKSLYDTFGKKRALYLAALEPCGASVIESICSGLEAFERALERAADEGALRAGARPRPAARQLVALVQGLALLGRIADRPNEHVDAVRAALAGLRA